MVVLLLPELIVDIEVLLVGELELAQWIESILLSRHRWVHLRSFVLKSWEQITFFSLLNFWVDKLLLASTDRHVSIWTQIDAFCVLSL